MLACLHSSKGEAPRKALCPLWFREDKLRGVRVFLFPALDSFISAQLLSWPRQKPPWASIRLGLSVITTDQGQYTGSRCLWPSKSDVSFIGLIGENWRLINSGKLLTSSNFVI